MDILKLLRQAYQTYRRRKSWQRVVRAMAMVVVFCTTYALILPAITLERQPECGFIEHTHTDSCYGKVTVHTHTEECCEYLIICGQEEHAAHSHTEKCNDTVATLICTQDHDHVATCYTYETGLACGLEETEGHTHEDACYQKNVICGLEEGAPESEAPLICDLAEHTHDELCYPEVETSEPTEEPTEPTEAPEEERQTHSFESEGLESMVALNADTTVPEDADLMVAPVEQTDESYAALAEQIENVVGATPTYLNLLDISFYDAEGAYLSVSETAQVSVVLEGKLFTDGAPQVYHFVDGTPVEIPEVEVSYFIRGEEGTQTDYTQLTFQTNGFSVFAVVKAEKSITDRVALDGVDPTQLAGTYYIACQHGTRDIDCSIKNGTGLDYYTGNYGAEWTFIQVSGNTYQIRCGTKYMVMSDTNGYVSLTEDAAAASVFTVSQGGNGYKLQVGNYYLNEYGGHNSIDNFRGYNVSNDDGNNLTLYPVRPKVDNLGGKQFVLVSNAVPKALGNYVIDNVNSVKGLGTNTVTLTTEDGVTYAKGDAPLWTFTATTTSGVYYISTTDANDVTKYLTLLAAPYNTDEDGRGSLTLSDTPQGITVTVNDDGTIFLSWQNAGGKTGYVNLDNTSENFWTHNEASDYSKLRLCQEVNLRDDFEIQYNTYVITVSLRDTAGNSMLAQVEDQTLTAGQTLVFDTLAPEITDYALRHAALENGDADPEVVSVTASDTGALLFTGSDGTVYTKEENVQITLVYYTATAHLNYEINSPSGWVVDGNFGLKAPYLDTTTQSVTATATQLYEMQGKNGAGLFIANTLSSRGMEKEYFNDFNEENNLMPGDFGYLPPGAEYAFLGWQANNVNGESCLFPENAETYMDDDGNLCIIDVNGVVQTVESGTTLSGKWKILSNAIVCFVNHCDTMLESETENAITDYNPEFYTEIAAIGHVYNIGDNPDYYKQEHIYLTTHEAIEATLRPEYDPAYTKAQIVIDAVKLFDADGNPYYEKETAYNERILEAAIAAYLRVQKDKTIKLDNAVLDQNMITPENYKLYWYSLKLEPDDNNAYHLDGVLVAKTQSMEIYKTFSGLSREQADNLIEQMTFPLHLIHTEEDTGGNSVEVKDDYTILNAAGSQEGVYAYEGPQSETSNIYKWTLQAVLGQRYAFEEEGYELSGYDTSSLVSVHYKDGFVDYVYDTDATYEDITVAGIDNAISGYFAGKPLIGGSVESVIFANFYTVEGTGMFTVSKVADDKGQVRLPGAVFTLMDADHNILQTKTTNENGAADFSGLAPGIYYLVESTEPTGYQKVDTEWLVTVTKNGTEVSVTIQENTPAAEAEEIFNTTQGIIDVFRIKNEPEESTVIVNKTFANISAAEVTDLYDDDAQWEDDYYIQILDEHSNVVYTLTLDKQSESLQQAAPVIGAMNSYTWTVNLDPNKTYTFVEKNYLHKNYLDTVVDANASCGISSITKTDTDANSEPDTASFTIDKSEDTDTVNITGTYTNTFTLRIHKVDATHGNVGLDGVEFNIYGDFQESSTGLPFIYTDDKGVTHTVYHKATVTTEGGGYAVYDGMKLSSGSRTFVYVVDEVQTPAGYVQLSQPIVRVIDIDSENYENGVYTLEIENFELTEELSALVTVTANKVWKVEEESQKVPVTFTLYQKTGKGDITSLGSVVLDGTDKTGTTAGGIPYIVTGWQVTWHELAYATTDSDVRYEYYVYEAPLPAYNTEYTTYLEELTLTNGTKVYGARVKDITQLNRTITVTNYTGYALPETGGIGTGWHTSLGLSLMAACIWLCWRGIYKKKRGGADTS